MSKYQQKDGDIAVFVSKVKKSEKAPDYTGTAMINGVEMRVALWQKTPTMLAGSIKVDTFAKGQNAHSTAKADGYAPKKDTMADEIPF
jgi:hypothetical protein